MPDPDSPGVSYTVEPVISYSVKDILARVENKLDAALIALAAKAEHSDLVSLSQRVAALELTEKERQDQLKAKTDWRRWLIPTILSAALTGVTIYALLH